MAKINLGILDGFNGKVGKVVGYNVNGKAVMRSYVGHIHNPRTADQMLSRARLSTLSKALPAFMPAAELGLKQRAKVYRHTVGNSFISVNYQALTGTRAADVDIDYTRLVIATGQLPQPGFGSAKFDQTLKVEVTFTGNLDLPHASEADKVYLFLYQPDTGTAVLGTPVLRSAEKVSVTVPSDWSGMNVHAYGFAVGSGKRQRCSASTYLGNGTIV